MRLFFLSDTHLGHDLPVRARSVAGGRGESFFEHFDRALNCARDSRVDLVLHGGDLFFRSRVPPVIVDRVYARIVRFVDESGIPVGVIAGNAERS
jgi:DNA repair protein SbcD/Mre11